MPQKRTWYSRFGIFLAIFLPGFPQLLRQRPRLTDGVVFLIGTGSLLGLIGLLVMLPVHAEPLKNFFWVSLPDLADIYPLDLNPAVKATENIPPILAAPNALIVRQPFWGPTFALYVVIYVLCASISVWDYRRSAQVAS